MCLDGPLVKCELHSRVFHMIGVRDTGQYFSGDALSHPFRIDTTSACFQSDGTEPWSTEAWKSIVRT